MLPLSGIVSTAGTRFTLPDRVQNNPGEASFAATDLAAYKLPEDIRIVDALPLTAGEKIDRRALVDQIAQPLA